VAENPTSYRRPVQVLVHPVCQSESGWRYLMLHRIPDRGAFWQGVSGGVWWGESLPAAARRELFEETGLHPARLVALHCSYSFAMQAQWEPLYAPGTVVIDEYVFLAVVDQLEPVLSPAEHDDWRWCTYEEARALLIWPENVVALRACQQALEAGLTP